MNVIHDSNDPCALEASLLAQSHALLDLTMMMFTAGDRERTAKQFEQVWWICGLNALSRCGYQIASPRQRQVDQVVDGDHAQHVALPYRQKQPIRSQLGIAHRVLYGR